MGEWASGYQLEDQADGPTQPGSAGPGEGWRSGVGCRTFPVLYPQITESEPPSLPRRSVSQGQALPQMGGMGRREDLAVIPTLLQFSS